MEVEEVVEQAALNLGPLSLIPVAIIFIVSILTKRTLFAMFCGVVSAALLKAGSLAGWFGEFTGVLYKTFSDESWQWIILVVALVGVLIHVFEKSGAAYGMGRWIEERVKSEKGVLLGTFFLGLIVFVDDYLSNLAVGATMKRISDKHRIPRTQLAFICLVMSGPVSQLIPISSWTVAYAGLFESINLATTENSVRVFISSIPFIFYAWVILAVLLLQIFGVIPKIGMIKRDSKRAAETGDVFPVGTDAPEVVELNSAEKKALESKPEPWSFLVPLVITIIVTAATGFDLIAGAAAGIIGAGIYYIAMRKMTFYEYLTSCFEGIMRMGFCYVLFVLAFSVQSLNTDLGMPEYVINAVKPLMAGAMLPMVTFIVCAIYAYFTGACWDLAMIIMPIVCPLAVAIGIDPILTAAAVFSGSLYGNVLCPYGDGVILTSQACDIKPMDTMYAIAPYMILGGVITAIMYLITGFIMA